MSELSGLDIVEVFENGVKLYRIKGVDNETFSTKTLAEEYIEKRRAKKRREEEDYTRDKERVSALEDIILAEIEMSPEEKKKTMGEWTSVPIVGLNVN